MYFLSQIANSVNTTIRVNNFTEVSISITFGNSETHPDSFVDKWQFWNNDI